jgi:two-component system, LytTR family, response regulator
VTAPKLRILIVDDEPIARRVLREELEIMPGVDLIGEADSGSAALRKIDKERPDLVLLDLQMPGMTGFEVVRSLRQSDHLPVFVIVTAFDQYAIEAFEAGAVDYLLKPVRHERLAQAINRARTLGANRNDVAQHVAQVQEIAGGAVGQPVRKIVGRTRHEYVLLNEEEVLAFEAEGDVVWILTAKQRYQATQTLKALEQRLRPSRFRRVHRGVLVNLDHVRRLAALSSQRWLITLSNGQEFIVSKRLAHNIRDILAG